VIPEVQTDVRGHGERAVLVVVVVRQSRGKVLATLLTIDRWSRSST